MPSKREILLLVACLGLAVLALFGRPLAQPADLNQYADQRALWGVPFALDVLTNLAFALAGAAGLRSLAWASGAERTQRGLARLFFVGLIATAFASGWYHLAPDDSGLAIDRVGMSIAFAGLLGLAAAARVSGRAGATLGIVLLVLAPASVLAWFATGNVLPWAVVQFGGMGLVLWLAVLRPLPGALPVRWSLVILAYALAKLLEVNDHLVFELTGQLVSGHSLKHVAASVAALPVLAAIHARAKSAQNAASAGAGERLARRPASRA